MENENNPILTFLKQLAFFHEIESDEEKQAVVARFEHFHIHEEQALYVKDDFPSGIYFVYHGELQALDYDNNTGELQIKETLSRTDYAGEISALEHKNHSVTLYAVKLSEILYLSLENFDWLIENYPQTKIYFKNSANTRKETRRKKFDWLNPGERIYQICRRHPIRLFKAIFLSFLFMLISSILLSGAYMTENQIFFYIALGVLVITFLITILYLTWHLFDWRLDMYYITNQRIQTQEHTWFFIEKMKSTPLHTVNGIDIKTQNFIYRNLFDLGTIRAHTTMDNITLTDLPNPIQTKNLIQELARRDKMINNDEFENDMKNSIEEIINGDFEEDENNVYSSIQSFDLAKPKAHNIFHTRTISEDGTITYHKHWIVLLEKISLPIIIIFSVLILAVVGIKEILRTIPLNVILVATAIGSASLIIAILWMIYQYLDWQNDIYQIRGNQIFDLEKKPFGREQQNISEIDNILSARYDKPTIWAKLFNYGDVIMELGKKDLSFNDIQDPSQALTDISARISEIERNKKIAAARQQRLTIKNYLNAYHQSNEEIQRLKDEEQDF